MRIIIQDRTQRDSGYSLAETVVSLAVSMIMLSGLISGFLQSAQTSEWSSYSLSAQSQALRGVEQVRAAKWDPLGFPSVDQITSGNFPVRVEILYIPMRGNNIAYVTNYTTITTVSSDPPLKMVRVDAVWGFFHRGLFTNSAFTYRAPDQ
jgi:type II secretory pathway component PulJ